MGPVSFESLNVGEGMPSKRYIEEQIVAELREAEKMQAPGATFAQGCKGA
jgi:hypothetical protein